MVRRQQQLYLNNSPLVLLVHSSHTSQATNKDFWQLSKTRRHEPEQGPEAWVGRSASLHYEGSGWVMAKAGRGVAEEQVPFTD